MSFFSMTPYAVHHSITDSTDGRSLSNTFEIVDDLLPVFTHIRNHNLLIPVSITRNDTSHEIPSACSVCPDTYGNDFNGNTKYTISNLNSVITATFPHSMFALYELLNRPTTQNSTCKTRSDTASHAEGRLSSSTRRSGPSRLWRGTTGATRRTSPSRRHCLLQFHRRTLASGYRRAKHRRSCDFATSHNQLLIFRAQINADPHRS